MDFGSVLHIIITGLVMLLMVCVLVAAHEYGHYLFARIFGMGVEEFAIGFGKKPIWTWMRKTYSVEAVPGPAGKSSGVNHEPNSFDYPTDGGLALQPEPKPDPTPTQVKLVTTETTDFTIRPWPLGGFVRIKGMMPEEDGSEIHVPGGFYSKAPWKRFIVLLAGPVFSVVAGIIILTGVHYFGGIGRPNYTPVLGGVTQDGPSGKAGLKPGDVITKVDGKPINKFYDVVLAVQDRANKPTQFEFTRNGKAMTAVVTPEEKDAPLLAPNLMDNLPARKSGRIGIVADYVVQKVGFGEAFIEAAKTPAMVVTKLISLISRPAELKEQVGGPIRIAQVTSEAVKIGPGLVILLAASLSISVGIFNLLPIPPLDGGQMMVAIAEMLRGGRRLSIKVQGAVAAVGFALVAVLFVTVLTIDIGRLTNKEKPVKIDFMDDKKAETK